MGYSNNRGPADQAVAELFIVTSTIVVFVRFYTRLALQKHFSVDDWLLLIALICMYAFCIFVILFARHGGGQRNRDLTNDQIRSASFFLYLSNPFYALATCFLKASIGVFFIRLTPHRRYIWTITGLLIINTVCAIIVLFCVIFACSPVEYYWRRIDGIKGHCLSPHVGLSLKIFTSSLNAVAEWGLALIPIFFVWNLQVSRRKKIGIWFLMALGVFSSSAVMVRLHSFVAQAKTRDVLYATADVQIWSMTEIGIGIIAVSVVVCGPLFKKITKSTKSQTSDGTPGCDDHDKKPVRRPRDPNKVTDILNSILEDHPTVQSNVPKPKSGFGRSLGSFTRSNVSKNGSSMTRNTDGTNGKSDSESYAQGRTEELPETTLATTNTHEVSEKEAGSVV